MKTFLLVSLSFSLAFSHTMAASSLRMFSDIDAAVQNAIASKRLMIFVLLNPASTSSATVSKMLNDNALGLNPDEFIVVTCSAGEAAHESLFSDRFKQDTSKAPIMVISDSTGSVLASVTGENPRTTYDKAVMEALIKAGLREAPKEPSMPSSSDSGVLEGSSRIFKIMKEDLVSKVVITDYRLWRLKNGESTNAALLEAQGEYGLFRKDGGGEVKIFFKDLIESDITYLEHVLSQSREPATE